VQRTPLLQRNAGSAKRRGVTTARNSMSLKLAEVASTAASLASLTRTLPRFRPFLGEVCRKPLHLQRHRRWTANLLREVVLSAFRACSASKFVSTGTLRQCHSSGDTATLQLGTGNSKALV